MIENAESALFHRAINQGHQSNSKLIMGWACEKVLSAQKRNVSGQASNPAE